MRLYIGLDDTDSAKKFCTTYLGLKIVDLLKDFAAELIEFPKLIRLNPNVPYKTRGNAAVSLTIDIDEKKLSHLFNYFTYLAIFVACLGLYGLVQNITEYKKKEIGIRKVLGSRVSSIALLLSKKFLLLVLASNFIAWPLAYFIMWRWLQDFAYRVNLSIWIFLLSGLTTLALALLSVSYRTIKAATANPMDSLKYE